MGDKLQSFTKYYWKVRVWDRDGKVSNWSETASFITGAFNKKDWQASWIGDQAEAPLKYPLDYKRIGYLSSYTDQDNEEKWVQIDLGKIIDFNKIRLYPSYNNIKHIKNYYFPLAYRIEVSPDGENWKQLVKVISPASGEKSVEHVLDKVIGRYIRFVATRLQRYNHSIHDYDGRSDPSKLFAFSLAEMEVLNNDKILSLGCEVTYKDALISIHRKKAMILICFVMGFPIHQLSPSGDLFRHHLYFER